MSGGFKYLPRAVYYLDIKRSMRNFIRVAFSDSWAENGAKVEEFRRALSQFTGFTDLHFCGHARIALFHILKFLSLSEGAEILITPVSLPEMLKMIRLNGLKVRFIGFKKNSFDLDYSSASLSEKTKAFLYTPLAGIHTPPEDLVEFCRKNGLVLIQDLTQSFAGRGMAQEIADADFNFWSLCDLKTLHTHRGGFVQSRHGEFNRYMQSTAASWFTVPSKRYFLSFIFEDIISGLFLNRDVFNFVGRFVVSLLRRIDPFLLENITAGYGFKNSRIKFLRNFMASGNDWRSDEIPPEQTYHYCEVLAETGLERLPMTESIISRRNSNIRMFYTLLSTKARGLAPANLRPERQLFWRAPLVVPDFLHFQNFLWGHKVDCARSNLPWLPDLIGATSPPGKEMKDQCVYLPIYHYLNETEVTYVAEKVNEYAERFT